MEEPGFLVGAPVAILNKIMEQRVFDGLVESGFDDLSRPYMPVFQMLAPEGDSISEIARKVGTTKQAMGYLITYLLKQGYVERSPDQADGRTRRIRRTDRGWEINRRSRELVKEVQADWETLIGSAEMSTLLRLLRELSAKLGAEYEGSVADVAVLSGRPVPRQRSTRDVKRKR